MRIVQIHEQLVEAAFAERAAATFAANPDTTSYTDDGEIVPGTLIALRWGTHKRAVLVLRLDETREPVVYSDLVPSDDDVPF